MLVRAAKVCFTGGMTEPETIILRLGGPVRVARLCEVTPQAVHQWKTKIPPARLMYLKAVRPDVFAAAQSEPPAPQREAGEPQPAQGR